MTDKLNPCPFCGGEADWMNANYSECDNVDTLYPIVSGMTKLMKGGHYDAIDSHLMGVDWSEMSPLAMVGTIRTTYPARHKLAKWCEVRDKIRVELNERGENASQLLRGLYV